MHTHLRHLIIGSSLVLSACDSSDEFEIAPSQPGQSSQPTPTDEVAPAPSSERDLIDGLDYDCAKVLAPIIMRVDIGTDCEFEGFEDVEGSWAAVSLFMDGSPMLQGLFNALPSMSPLSGFCRYDYIGDGTDVYGDYEGFLRLVKSGRLPHVYGDSAAVDCPVMGPMTDQGLDTADGREALHEAFMTNINAISAADLEGVNRHATRLALLDTVADGFTPYNEHGLELESLIADIACPGDTSTCGHWIHPVLVTPRVLDDLFATADWYNGGNVGYMHEFSMGLVFALQDWSEHNLGLPVTARERLVVSAAVGADPSHPIASDPNYAPAQSTIAALQAAYCMGAVVYAAAGNTRDTSCPNTETGMLAPASYESLAVPSAAQCVAWGYVPYDVNHTYDPASPLIHAVGGLDGRDQFIANHRRVAHPALHATASDAISSEGTVTITGTSVATAVAAGAHLLIWSIEPNLSGNEVATLLYDTGYNIGKPADAGMYINNYERIHRLGICQALDEYLLDLDCAYPYADPYGNLGEFELAMEDAIAEADLADLLIGPDSAIEGEEPVCGDYPNLDTFIRPQPERPACSNCNGVKAASGNTHMLNMSIANQSWTIPLHVASAYLHTYDAAGTATTFDLAAVVPSINDAIPSNVIQVPFTVAWPASAVLEFVYTDGTYYTKQSNAIPLLQ